jgi:hypothetical protein
MMESCGEGVLNSVLNVVKCLITASKRRDRVVTRASVPGMAGTSAPGYNVTIPEKASNSAADFRAFDPLSPPDGRFRQNVWESGTGNRVPKYGWLSGSS